jgi:hypothetical protein
MFNRNRAKIFYRNRETGALSLALATLLLLMSTIGLWYLAQNSILIRKNTSSSRKRDVSKSSATTAALMAKMLISRDVPDGNLGWSTEVLIDPAVRTTNLPRIYPMPYVAGSSIGSSATPPSNFDRREITPIPTSEWWSVASNANFNVVTVFTNNMANVTGAIIAGIHGTPGTGAGATDTLSKSSSELTYSLRNCTSNGINSSTYTGRYCVSANIVSGANKGLVELGLLVVPPDPICDRVTGVSLGASFSVTITASGIVTGYVINVNTGSPAATIVSLNSGSDPKYLAWNSATAKVPSVINVPISTPQQRCIVNNKVTINVTLKSVTGEAVQCAASADVPAAKAAGTCIATAP